MLKRHFTVIYGQLDELKETVARVESNIADMAVRMQELDRKLGQFESSRSEMSEAGRTTRDLASAIDEMKRDINSLRARFESEMLSIGDPFNSREKPSGTSAGISTSVTAEPIETAKTIEEVRPVEPQETSQAQSEAVSTPAQSPEPAQVEEAPKPEQAAQSTSESSTEDQYEPTVKSLEEQLGLVPPSADTANQEQNKQESKPEEKKKRRFF